MKEKINIGIRGNVKIQLSGIEVLNSHNDVQNSAINIVKYAISNSARRINYVRIKDGSTILHERSIPISEVSFPVGDGNVRFRMFFDENSFSGTFDSMELGYMDTGGRSPSLLNFSILSGFTPIEKTSDNSMLLTWDLNITIT